MECDCISSPNYPGDYPASDHCVINVEQGTALHVLEFLTEQDYDLLWVNGQSYSYTEGPDGVEAEGQIEWTSDTHGTEGVEHLYRRADAKSYKSHLCGRGV